MGKQKIVETINHMFTTADRVRERMYMYVRACERGEYMCVPVFDCECVYVRV